MLNGAQYYRDLKYIENHPDSSEGGSCCLFARPFSATNITFEEIEIAFYF
jgi:hypothetical protein